MGRFLGVAPEALRLLPQTRQAVQEVIAGLPLNPGDEVLASDHEYPLCRELWLAQAQARGFAYREMHLPLPLATGSHDDWVERVWKAVTPQTRVLYFSHITCLTALVTPVRQLCQRAREQGIVTVVDGAHAVGQLEVNLSHLDPDFYAGCLHKWVGAPYGAAFLYAKDHEPAQLPLSAEQQLPLLASLAALEPLLADPTSMAAELRRARSVALRAREVVTSWTGLPAFQPIGEEWTARMIALPLPPTLGEAMKVQHHLAARGFSTNVHDWQGKRILRLCVGKQDGQPEVDALLEALHSVPRPPRPSLWAAIKRRILR